MTHPPSLVCRHVAASLKFAKTPKGNRLNPSHFWRSQDLADQNPSGLSTCCSRWNGSMTGKGEIRVPYVPDPQRGKTVGCFPVATSEKAPKSWTSFPLMVINSPDSPHTIRLWIPTREGPQSPFVDHTVLRVHIPYVYAVYMYRRVRWTMHRGWYCDFCRHYRVDHNRQVAEQTYTGSISTRLIYLE